MKAILVLLGLALGVEVHAQGLSDPTRPPGASSGMTQAAGPGEELAISATQLQSVLIAPGRRVAVINGQAVALGGMVGEAKVVKISETEVVLRRGAENEVLKMYPGVEKQATKRRIPRQGGAK